MKNIAFPVRRSVRESLKVPVTRKGIEVYTRNRLENAEAGFIEKADFSGSIMNHYYVSGDNPSLDALLEASGISSFVSAHLHASMNPETVSKPFKRPQIMAVANATPDSFYAGSRLDSSSKLLDALIDSSPDIIDIGGESTRPGSLELSVEEEISRIKPVIGHVTSTSNIPVSLDTRHPEVLSFFADRVEYANDISGFRDSRMIDVASENSLKCITMHMQGEPHNMQDFTRYVDMVPEILAFLLESAERLSSRGIPDKNIFLDPGIGFSKDFQGNLEILNEIGSFSVGYGTLVGASRKSFIGRITGEETQGRLSGTLAVTVYLAMNGVNIIRAHDPKENLQALKVLEAIFNNGY